MRFRRPSGDLPTADVAARDVLGPRSLLAITHEHVASPEAYRNAERAGDVGAGRQGRRKINDRSSERPDIGRCCWNQPPARFRAPNPTLVPFWRDGPRGWAGYRA